MARRRRSDWIALRRYIRAPKNRRDGANSYRRSLRFELLEDRRMRSITVGTLQDVVDLNDGVTSLREAIFAANTVPGHDSIEFASTLTLHGPATILLTLGELRISDDLTIDGPGAELLTIDASGSDENLETTGNGSRIFNVDDGIVNQSIDVEISGLALIGGDPDGQGGAILSSERLVASELVISGNRAAAGGGIALFIGTGNSTVQNSTITDNTAGGSGGGVWIQGGQSGIAIISGNHISDNTALQGGGIFAGQAPAGSRAIISGNTISGNMSINGAGICLIGGQEAPRTTIDGNSIALNIATGQGGGIFNSSLDLSVINSVLSNNEAGTSGGGIHNDGDLTITASTISGNVASRGGGVYSRMGELAINFSTISGNTALADGGGVYSRGARLAVTGSTVTGNEAIDDDGGGLWISTENLGPAAISDSTISDNMATGDGGGLYFSGGDPGNAGLTLTNVTVSGNRASRGGGIAAAAFSGGVPGGRVTTHGGSITGNTASLNGGGVYTRSGFLAINGTIISANSASMHGGGIATPNTVSTGASMLFVGATINANMAGPDGNGGGLWLSGGVPVTLSETRISGNHALRGGGIFRQSTGFGTTLAAIDSAISDNSARTHGGGIYNVGGVLTFTRSTISGNSNFMTATLGNGGGIFNRGANLSLVSSSVIGNSAPSGRGGGIHHENAGLTINASTIANNFALQDGAGVSVATGRTTILSSTISGNSSTIGVGGLYLSSMTSISHSTIAGNSTQSGRSGGMSAGRGGQILEIDHTIIAGNVNSNGIVVDLNSQSASSLFVRFSLIGDNTGTNLAEAPLGSPDANGNLVGKPANAGGSGVIDPLLRPLSNYGGPTLTHAPLPGSPVLDAGAAVTTPLGYDQRGMPFQRAVDVDGDGVIRIDIGSIEAQSPPILITGDYNLDGRVDAGDYVRWRNTLGEHVDEFDGADGDGDGIIGLGDYQVWKMHLGMTVPFSGAGGLAFASTDALDSAFDEPSNPIALFPTGSPAVGLAQRFTRPAESSPTVLRDDDLVVWLASFDHDTSDEMDESTAANAADFNDNATVAVLDQAFALLGTGWPSRVGDRP